LSHLGLRQAQGQRRGLTGRDLPFDDAQHLALKRHDSLGKADSLLLD
jgi:hypothetical protein